MDQESHSSFFRTTHREFDERQERPSSAAMRK